MATRYRHVPTEVLTGIADLVGGLLWESPKVDDGVKEPTDDDDDGPAGVSSGPSAAT